LLVLVGGFFLVNLILAVINESFIHEREKKLKAIEKEMANYKRFRFVKSMKDTVTQLTKKV